MARKADTIALCKVTASRPRAIEQTLETYSDVSNAIAALLAMRDTEQKEGRDPYLYVLLPFDRKGGAFLPPST